MVHAWMNAINIHGTYHANSYGKFCVINRFSSHAT